MNCQNASCENRLNWFRQRVSKKPGYYMETHWYCSEPCLETGILQRLEKSSRPKDKSGIVSNRTRFGFLLLQNGVITKEQLDLALAEQQKDTNPHPKEGEERLGHYLQSMGFIKERDITMALSRQFSLPVINLINLRSSPKAMSMVPAAIIQRLKFLPVDYDTTSNSLLLVTYDPSVIPSMINLRGILNCDLSIYLGDEDAVRQLIQQVISSTSVPEGSTESLADSFSSDLIEISSMIVERARDTHAKSLNVGYFHQLVWSRFGAGAETEDLVVEHVPVIQLQSDDQSG